MKKSKKFRTFAGILAWIIALGTIPPVVSGAEEIENEIGIYEEEEYNWDEPVEPESEVTEPEETEAEVIEPEETEVEVIEPEETEAEVIEPEETEPEVIEPEETEAEVTEPEETEPEETEAEVIEPEETAPEVIEPEEEPQPEEIPEIPLYEQLLLCETLTELYELVTAEENAETLALLTEEEITELLAKTDDLYNTVFIFDPMNAELALSAEIVGKLNALPNAPVVVPEEEITAEGAPVEEELPAEEEILTEEPAEPETPAEEIPEESEEIPVEEPAETPEQTLEVYGLVKVSGRIPEGVELTAEMLDETEPEEPAEEPVWDIVDDESIEDIVIDEEILYDDEIIFFDDMIVEAPVFWSSGEEADEPAEETETEYAFAIDITLYDEFGEVWQPDEPVEVTLDAYALGLNDGDEIQILHEHDGWENDLGVYTVEEGELVFEVDGFSVMRGILMETAELTMVEQDAETYLAAISADNDVWTAQSATTQTIELKKNVRVDGTITIGNNVTLRIIGNGFSIFKGDTSDYMFKVDGGTLKIENAIIDGKVTWKSTPVEGDVTRKLYNVTAIDRKSVTMADNGRDTAKAYTSAIYSTKGTITLNNVTMQNLYGNTDGAATAIETEGTAGESFVTVNLTNVTVQDCLSTSGHSILLLNNSLTKMDNCKFYNNYAGNSYSGVIKAGGPSYYCHLEMNNCEASGNYSSGWGGVILWAANTSIGDKTGNNETRAIINGCNFSGNTARYLGGAISNEALMTITNCTISNNVAMAGGGIATFPYTRTEIDTSGGNACGLTLGSGNLIQGNHALADKEFKPFSESGMGAGQDFESTILGENAIEYPGGGGGIWCYMNKPEWTCSLEIGEKNTIANNIANNMGGGVYLHKVAGKEATLSIKGADINSNRAVNGGGVAVKDANVNISDGSIVNNTATKHGGGVYMDNATEGGNCSISGEGKVNHNTAVNGGGFYIANGTINVSGGYVQFNKAESDTTLATAYESASNVGVGGGIYVDNGAFSMVASDGNTVGIYDNSATNAADDVYAAPGVTSITIPEVTEMKLYDEDGKEVADVENWYEDYAPKDTHYESGLKGRDDFKNGSEYIMRYDTAAENYLWEDYKVPYKIEDTSDTNPSPYVCLTLGYARHKIDLTIKKIVTGNMGDINRDFKFTISVINPDKSEGVLTPDIPVGVEWDEVTKTFTLKNNEQIVFNDIFVEAIVSVEEIDADGYTTTINYYGKDYAEQAIEQKIVADGKVITFTNHKEADIDTAVTLDILPYIILFSIVGTGVILTSADRRRTDED